MVNLFFSHQLTYADFNINLLDLNFSLCLKPVSLERHIGIDQGIKNFAIAVIDKSLDSNPKIVAVEHYNLNLANINRASGVLIALCYRTNLLNWMQQLELESGMARVDRVIVHFEQITLANKKSKAFGIELGNNCITFFLILTIII